MENWPLFLPFEAIAGGGKAHYPPFLLWQVGVVVHSHVTGTHCLNLKAKHARCEGTASDAPICRPMEALSDAILSDGPYGIILSFPSCIHTGNYGI